MPRKIAWFSAGATSALDQLAKEKYPDNKRSIKDIEKCVGVKSKRLKSDTYIDIWDVWTCMRKLDT